MQTYSEVIWVTEVSKRYRSRKQTDGLHGFARGLFCPSYVYHQALDGISLSLNRGDSLGFLGANGAGKSTFAKILCGIQRPTTGQVEVLGFTPHTRASSFYKKLAWSSATSIRCGGICPSGEVSTSPAGCMASTKSSSIKIGRNLAMCSIWHRFLNARYECLASESA